jgi:hypothetical protein
VVVKRARNFLTLSGRFFPAAVREKANQLALFQGAAAKPGSPLKPEAGKGYPYWAGREGG